MTLGWFLSRPAHDPRAAIKTRSGVAGVVAEGEEEGVGLDIGLVHQIEAVGVAEIVPGLGRSDSGSSARR